MSDEDGKRPIVAPEPNQKREGARAIIEAIASVEPVSAALTRIYQTTHPPKSETDRQAWQQAISQRTNEHTGRLDDHEQLLSPKKTLTGVTAQLIIVLARDCPDGLGHKNYELSDLCSLIPDIERQAIEDAVYDLEHYGLLSLTHAVGGDWWAKLTPQFYEQVDEQLMGWNPHQDAIMLARSMLDANEGRAAQLHTASGWSKRRFNPAFRVLSKRFPKERVSREIQPHYVAASIILLPEDRARLRRILEDAAYS